MASDLVKVARLAAENVAAEIGARVYDIGLARVHDGRGAIEVIFVSDADGRWSVDLLWTGDGADWALVGVSRSRAATQLYIEGELEIGGASNMLRDDDADPINDALVADPVDAPLVAEVELADYDLDAIAGAITRALGALWPQEN